MCVCVCEWEDKVWFHSFIPYLLLGCSTGDDAWINMMVDQDSTPPGYTLTTSDGTKLNTVVIAPLFDQSYAEPDDVGTTNWLVNPC